MAVWPLAAGRAPASAAGGIVAVTARPGVGAGRAVQLASKIARRAKGMRALTVEAYQSGSGAARDKGLRTMA
jgi:hypothetical protein